MADIRQALAAADRFMMTAIASTPSGQPSTDNLIGASTDAEAVGVWLRNYQKSPRTYEAYSREAFRLVAWATVNNLSLRRLTFADVQSYVAFLRNPQPHDAWCSGKTARRDRGDWKPFKGPLSDGGVAYALTVLSSMYTWFERAQFIRGNVFALAVADKKQVKLAHKQDRMLESDHFTSVWDFLNNAQGWVKPTILARRRWAFALLSATGMRISEPRLNSMASFDYSGDLAKQGVPGWSLKVIGKGKKVRKIPVADSLLGELARYRHAMHLSSLPLPDERHIPLIQVSPTNKSPAAKATLDRDLHELFQAVAAGMEPHAAHRLLQASAHWLRHSFATQLLDAGLSSHDTQELMGHASLSTLGQYSHGSLKVQAQIIGNLSLGTKPRETT